MDRKSTCKCDQTVINKRKKKKNRTAIFTKMSTIQESQEIDGNEFDSDSIQSSTPLLVPDSVRYPKDRYHFVSFTFMLLGLASLLPWCFFTTATDYWMYKFRNTSSPYPPADIKEKTYLQTSFGSSLSIASNLPSFFTLLLSTHLTTIPEKYRNGISQVSVLVVFIITSSFIYIDTDTYQTAFFAFTMITVVILNISGAIFQSAVVGLVALFPKQYMHSMVTGQAIAGVFAAVAQLLSMAGDSSPKSAALIFFISAVVGLILTIVCYYLIHGLDFFQFYVQSSQNSAQFTSASFSSVPDDYISNFKLLKKVWTCALCIVLTFTVTISVFPSMVILVVSSSSNNNIWSGRLFLPLTCFLLFNAGDLCGRLVSGFLPLASTGPNLPNLEPNHSVVKFFRRRDDLVLLAFSVLRIVLVPLFMLCNAHPRVHLPVWFDNDNYFIGFMILLGFSNGFIFCGAMMLAPKFVPPAYQERVGTLLTVSLGAGLTLGSLMSFPLVMAL